MTPHATALPIQLRLDPHGFPGQPVRDRYEDRGVRLQFRDGGEVWDWLTAFLGPGWRLVRPLGSPFQLSWMVIADEGMIGHLHIHLDVPFRASGQ